MSKRPQVGSWILRLLITIVVLMGGGMLMLGLVSGTGDAQKSGLEQALARALDAKTTIGTLKEFNIAPQFSVAAENITAQTNKTNKQISLGYGRVAFGLFDIITSKRTIEDIELKDLKSDGEIWGPQPVTLKLLKIDDSDLARKPRLTFSGTYGTETMTGWIEMEKKINWLRPNFRFTKQNKMEMHLGNISIEGNFKPYGGHGQKIEDAKITIGKTECSSKTLVVQNLNAEIFLKLIDSKTKETDIQTLCEKLSEAAKE
jgi:hypothetical protein